MRLTSSRVTAAMNCCRIVLVSNGIPFRLGEKEVKNGMTCKGDTLRLPSGKPYNRLYLLAASTDADHTVTFSVGDRETQAFIPITADSSDNGDTPATRKAT